MTSAQLLNAGLDSAAIRRRVQAGRLHRIHRGVYAVGHPQLSQEGRWMAGVLACGEGAVLSHRAAAALLRIRDSGLVEVTVPSYAGRRRPGLVVHRSATLTPAVVTRRHGIPVTTPARTLEDLRRLLPAKQFRQATRQAQILGLNIGAMASGPVFTRSDLELLFMRICRRYRIPKPEVNALVGPYEVDFLWREQRLIAEADSWQYHGNRISFEDDRLRDARLGLLGFLVKRFSDRELTDRPAFVAAVIRAALDERAGARP